MKLKMTKKKILIAAVLIAMTASGMLAKQFLQPAAKADDSSAEFQRTVRLEKGSLEDAVVIKGTVKSAESSSVTAVVQGKIKDLKVKEGDIVKKGDIIAVLDNADLSDEIAKKKKDIAQAKADLKTAFDRLTKQQEEAGAHKDQVAREQSDLVSRAKTAADDAARTASSCPADVSSAKAQLDSATALIKNNQDIFDEAYSRREDAYKKNQAGQLTEEEFQQFVNSYLKAESELMIAKSKNNYDTLNAAYTEAQSKCTAAQTARDTAANAYQDALNAQKSAMAAEDKAISELNVQAAEAKKKWMDYTGEDELKELDKKADSSSIRAETSGKVTELKAKIGSVPKDEIATIQSVDNLVVETSVQPYDVSRIKAEQKVILNADTSKQDIQGKVIRISSTASGGGTDGSGASFTVLVQIMNPDSVYIGTSVTGRIIVSEKEDVYTVPKDAVSTEDGGSYVMVMKEDGTYQKTNVETGDANEFNIEIKGPDVKEGMEVLAVYDWNGLRDQQKEKISNADSQQQ